jgi:acyl-CoA synthetase (AMP-forming)/AMP-acid ligase II
VNRETRDARARWAGSPAAVRHLDLVAEPARRQPDAIALVGNGRRLTFAQLDERVGRLGAGLRAGGLAPGDRVALLAANELEYLEIQAACLRSGFTLVPLNRRLADSELDFILRDADASVLVAGRHDEAAARRVAARGCRVVGLGESEWLEPYDALLEAEPDPDADPADPELAATILYTSGTTGRPKGAVVDRHGFTARVLVNLLEVGPRAGDRWLQVLPMFHIAAFLGYAFVYAGATVEMLESFDPAGCLEAMRDGAVSATVVVPTILQLLLERVEQEAIELPHLRLVVYGGSVIEPGLLRRAIERLGCGFHQQYGMTETGAQTILRPADHDPDDPERLASAGSEAVTFSVRVVGPGGKELPPGELGEIVCRGPAVTAGYWRREEATADAWGGGWFHTGDLGRRDERGYLHVVDRGCDLIVTGGENVYPREVESALLEHPGVLDAAVIGLPDPRWGQVVTAVVVGSAPDEELAHFMLERVARYKIPRRWVRVGELPRNATGKVLRAELRAGLAGERLVTTSEGEHAR